MITNLSTLTLQINLSTFKIYKKKIKSFIFKKFKTIGEIYIFGIIVVQVICRENPMQNSDL